MSPKQSKAKELYSNFQEIEKARLSPRNLKTMKQEETASPVMNHEKSRLSPRQGRPGSPVQNKDVGVRSSQG